MLYLAAKHSRPRPHPVPASSPNPPPPCLMSVYLLALRRNGCGNSVVPPRRERGVLLDGDVCGSLLSRPAAVDREHLRPRGGARGLRRDCARALPHQGENDGHDSCVLVFYFCVTRSTPMPSNFRRPSSFWIPALNIEPARRASFYGSAFSRPCVESEIGHDETDACFTLPRSMFSCPMSPHLGQRLSCPGCSPSCFALVGAACESGLGAPAPAVLNFIFCPSSSSEQMMPKLVIVANMKWPVAWWNLPAGSFLSFVRCGRGIPSGSSEA